MAPRRQQPKKKRRQSSNNAAAITKAPAQTVVTNQPKRDTIVEYDFFGFPASVFAADLKRTGWATLVILALLGVVTFIVRSV